MTCDVLGRCRPYPICHLCGQCGQHCQCRDSPARDAADRTDIQRVRDLYSEEARAQEARANRYIRRWTDTKRKLDLALKLSRSGDRLRAVEMLRAEMDRPISRTDARSAEKR